MTDKEFDRELKIVEKGIFQTHCAINMCGKMLKEEFGYTEDDVKYQIIESLGFMIDYTVYGMMAELDLSDSIENRNRDIIYNCIMNNYSLKDYKDELISNYI